MWVGVRSYVCCAVQLTLINCQWDFVTHDEREYETITFLWSHHRTLTYLQRIGRRSICSCVYVLATVLWVLWKASTRMWWCASVFEYLLRFTFKLNTSGGKCFIYNYICLRIRVCTHKKHVYIYCNQCTHTARRTLNSVVALTSIALSFFDNMYGMHTSLKFDEDCYSIIMSFFCISSPSVRN